MNSAEEGSRCAGVSTGLGVKQTWALILLFQHASYVTLDVSLSCLNISVLPYEREIIASVLKVVVRIKNDNM